MKMSAPWFEFYRKIEALFEQDPEVNVTYDDDAKTVKVFVENCRKADAIAKLLPVTKNFGGVELKIEVIPANDEESAIDIIEEAFYGNPALAYTHHVKTPLGDFDYVVFQNRVVQYYNDELCDINGNKSTLYQEIAKDVFENTNVFFCTDTEDNDEFEVEV